MIAEYFICNPLVTQPILSDFQTVSLLFLNFRKFSNDSSYNMMQRLFLVAIASNESQVISHGKCTIASKGHSKSYKSF